MKTQFVTIGILMAALATATAFADDAQSQMNGQMGQPQTGSTTTTTTTQSTTDQSSPANSTDNSGTGTQATPNSSQTPTQSN